MTRGPSLHLFGRLTVLLTTVALLIGLWRSAAAAPASQVESAVDEIRRQVSQIRGLAVQADTPIVTLPRPALVSRLSRELNADRAVREFLTSQMLLEVLGAMERGFDLRQLQLRLLEEQTIAVYDFEERVILLAADAAGADLSPDTRLVLAHELTHALQDQHFSLKRLLPANPENSDAALAARALSEGDAMLTMRIWGRQFLRPTEKRALGDETVVQDPVLDSAPPLVQGELLFPYDAGWVFAQLLYQDGGFEAVNQAFARPPRSTEQILHPEKWLAGESPVAVSIAPLEQGLGGTWKTLRTDVFGELVLRLLLEPNVGWPTAEAAAAGWGGDAYTILEDAEGRRIVAVVTVWDTDGDAAEMYNAFVASIPAQYQSGQRRTLALPSMARWTTPEYQVQALKSDRTVRLVYAPDEATLDLVDALIANATVGPSGPVAPLPTPTATPPPPPPTAVPPPTMAPLPEPAESTDDAVPPTPATRPVNGPTPTLPPAQDPRPSTEQPAPRSQPTAQPLSPGAGEPAEDGEEPSEP